MAVNPSPDQGPSLWAHLSASLDVYRDEHEGQFAPAETAEEVRLLAAMDGIQKHAFRLLATGRIPDDLEDHLSDFEQGSNLEHKIRELLSYNLVQHRIEFDLAEDVVWRLHKLPQRIQISVIAFLFLLKAAPSDTAVKYLERAVTLFLAGYTTEVFVMCGAVLESAMAARFPDEQLRAAGMTPAYRYTGVFSLGQRMSHEEKHPIFSKERRALFWEAISWRNDAVHVQPDLGPAPELAVLYTASLLSSILPHQIP